MRRSGARRCATSASCRRRRSWPRNSTPTSGRACWCRNASTSTTSSCCAGSGACRAARVTSPAIRSMAGPRSRPTTSRSPTSAMRRPSALSAAAPGTISSAACSRPRARYCRTSAGIRTGRPNSPSRASNPPSPTTSARPGRNGPTGTRPAASANGCRRRRSAANTDARRMARWPAPASARCSTPTTRSARCRCAMRTSTRRTCSISPASAVVSTR